MKSSYFLISKVFVVLIILFACNSEESNFSSITMNANENDESGDNDNDNQVNDPQNYNLLSLGDSYTIGQSVCETCRFPDQLKDSLNNYIMDRPFELQIIARTGWTTTSLINAINEDDPPNNFDLVTLLIGVNNQYQGKPFSLYEQEFPELVDTAIQKARGISNNVIVISIPDYAFTPFGGGNTSISEEIDQYNLFAEQYCDQNNISYVYITDITREGLSNPELVASDNLHPSELAYSRFVERILPIAIDKLQ